MESIQKEVNKIAKKQYESDDCPPNFLVSLLYENGDHKKDNFHKIALTITHNGYVFTKVIFPDLTQTYGYENLSETMMYMYNKTM